MNSFLADIDTMYCTELSRPETVNVLEYCVYMKKDSVCMYELSDYTSIVAHYNNVYMASLIKTCAVELVHNSSLDLSHFLSV